MRRAVLAVSGVAVGLLAAACGGVGGPHGGPPTSFPSPSARAGSSASGGPDCQPGGNLPSADVVVDLSTRGGGAEVSMRVGQTLRVQAEEGCGGHSWRLSTDAAPSPSPPGSLTRIRAGGVAPDVKGTEWALFRADMAGTARIGFPGGAFCPGGAPCPLYLILAPVTVVISP